MLEEYLFKSLIAFISLQALSIVFQPILSRLHTKNRTGRIRALLNGMLVSLIPVVRWIMVGLILFVTFMASNEEFVEQYNKKQDSKENGGK